MKFRDLGRQYQALKPEIDANIQDILTNSSFILGAKVQELEEKLAEYVGTNYCVTCGNGTDALILSLMLWNIGPGDAVFVPNFTYFASANCALLRGATVILVDIDPRTFNMDPNDLEKRILRVLDEGKLTPRVVIPVDLFGLPADYDAILPIAQKYNLKVLEDGAQGFGGTLHGKRACSFGDLSTTSFFPAKPLGCYGDGGAIFTDDLGTAEELKSLRAQGRSPEDKYDNRTIGLNSRLDTLQAAILLPKLKALEEYELDAVNQAAKVYTEQLQDLVTTPLIKDGFYSSWAQYTIQLPAGTDRSALQSKLKEHDIPTMIYYPRTMTQQTVFSKQYSDSHDHLVSETVVTKCLSIPIHPYLEENEILTVATNIKRCI